MVIENRKLIAAPRSIVWNVTVDVERWPQWTPTVERVIRLDDGPFEVGSVARIKQPGLPEAEWRVTSLTEGEGFTWEARVRGMRMVASHALTSSGNETTSMLSIDIRGFVAVLLCPLIRAYVEGTLEQENAGLKRHCEALEAGK